MHKTIGPFIAASLFLGFAGASHADTITFDDIAGGGCANAGANTSSVGYDFALNVPGSLVVCDSTSQNRLASNGTNYLASAASAGTPFLPSISMTKGGGGLFDLISVDFAELFENGDFADGANPTGVTVTGNLGGGGVVAALFNLDGFNDGTGAGADFENFVLGAGFTGLTSVDFAGSGAPGFSNIFNILAIDNIVVRDSAAAVPAPGTLALLGLGLAGIGAMRRRKS